MQNKVAHCCWYAVIGSGTPLMTSKMDMTQIDFHDLLYNLYTCYSSYNNKIYIVCHAEQMDVIFITLYSPKHTHTHTHTQFFRLVQFTPHLEVT